MRAAGLGTGGLRLLRSCVQVGLLLAASAAGAETWHVDAAKGSRRGDGSEARPLATISAALERATAGDEVRVAPGRYREHVVLKTRVALRGGGAPSTTIDVTNLRVLGAVVCADGALLQGFRIVDPGPAQGTLAAIDCSNGSSPEIAHNLIEAPNRPAILLESSDAWIHHNTIRGGAPVTEILFGVVVGSGRPVIEDNEIASNAVAIGLGCGPGEEGGRIQRNVLRGRVGVFPPVGSDAVPVTISDNLFLPSVAAYPVRSGLDLGAHHFYPFGTLAALVANNTFHSTDGIFVSGGEAVIANNVVVNGAVGISVNSGVTPDLRGNDVFGNAIPLVPDTNYLGIEDPTGSDGNLSADPQFADVLGEDFRPRPGSPLLDAGSGADVASALDLAGEARVADGDGDGAAAVDIGAREFQPGAELPLPALAITIDLLPRREPNVTSVERILRGRALVKVAIFSDAELDAGSEIDVASLTLGRSRVRRCRVRQLDEDRVRDLLCTFPIGGLPASGPVCVRGATLAGQPLVGCDALQLVP
jgi:hypothetical protein